SSENGCQVVHREQFESNLPCHNCGIEGKCSCFRRLRIRCYEMSIIRINQNNLSSDFTLATETSSFNISAIVGSSNSTSRQTMNSHLPKSLRLFTAVTHLRAALCLAWVCSGLWTSNPLISRRSVTSLVSWTKKSGS